MTFGEGGGGGIQGKELEFGVMGNAMAAVKAMDRLLDQLSGCLDAEAARKVVELEIDEETRARVSELGEKANEGTISAEELEEYKSYVEMGDLITILKLKAKQRLAAASGA